MRLPPFILPRLLAFTWASYCLLAHRLPGVPVHPADLRFPPVNLSVFLSGGRRLPDIIWLPLNLFFPVILSVFLFGGRRPPPVAVAMAELARLQNDPNYVFEFALGPPSSTLVDQTGAPPELNLNIQNRVSNEVTRYVMKSAHLSVDDLRMFDVSTGKLAMVSHHPGKNPVCPTTACVLRCLLCDVLSAMAPVYGSPVVQR